MVQIFKFIRTVRDGRKRFGHAIPLSVFMVLLAAGMQGVVWGQTVLLDPSGDGGFENGTTFTANGWTTANNAVNYWVVGTATIYAGTSSAYISNNGTANTYTNTDDETSHFYRDISVPSGQTIITLSFQYKGTGEAGYDRLLVYTAPTSVTPVAGVPVQYTTDITGATLVFTQTATQANYTLQTITLPTSLAGTTFRLIFTWQNDNNTGTDPPSAVDNISVISANLVLTAGTTSASIPSGVTCARVEAWGGGGHGGNMTGTGAAGGGGGGGYSRSVLAVTPGNYTVQVGAGSVNTAAGGDTWFSTSTTVMARGGSSVADNGTTGASGGAIGYGEVKYTGGKGGDVVSGNSGGGGGGAGSTGNGGDASGTTAGTGTFNYGGNGGAGRTSNGNGNAGSVYGGGGGGERRNSTTNRTPGNGANGLLIITWGSISSTAAPFVNSPICEGATTVSGTSENNASIVVYTGGSTQIGTATANGSGVWSATVVALSAGQTITATAKVIDKCLSAASTAVTVNPLPSFTTSVNSQVSCYGGADGKINLTMTSANKSPYTFSIDNGVNYTTTFTGSYPNFILTDLSAITQKIRVKDVNTCLSAACP